MDAPSAEMLKRNHLLSLADLRETYRLGELHERNADPDPIVQFQMWFHEAKVAELKEPNAMSLATATPTGVPSCRIVLLKEVSEIGFVFYTNYTSRKADELRANPKAALTFYWAELERSVRVVGGVETVDRETSERYFRSRPRGSRLGAWVSRQSQNVGRREDIEARLHELEATYNGSDDIPAPEFWGGYRVNPTEVEFWQGRPNRLHDRLVYRRQGTEWHMERLWP